MPGELKALLPTEADLSWSDHAEWRLVTTVSGEGTSAFNPCMQKTLEYLGARRVARRDFVLFAHVGDVEGSYLRAVVAEFDDPAVAGDTYGFVADRVEHCEPLITGHEADRYRVLGGGPVDTGDGVPARTLLSAYGPVPGDLSDGASYFLETGVAVAGNRLLILTSRVIGRDYSFDTTPMKASLSRAVDRLG